MSKQSIDQWLTLAESDRLSVESDTHTAENGGENDGGQNADIVIVGLGPGQVDDLTLGAWRALATALGGESPTNPRTAIARTLIVRTVRHPIVDLFPGAFQSCDDLYDAHDDFRAVYGAITARVIGAAQQGPVLYAVPGHACVGEATTGLIRTAAAAAGLTVQVVGGVSFVDATFAAVGVDPMDGSQVVDAMLVARQHHPQVEVGLPLLVAQVYARWLASGLKLTLMNAYPDDHPVTVIAHAGTPEQRCMTMPLHKLDHGEIFDHMTSVYVPPLQDGGFTDLQAIVAHLRAPEGCPWDQEQTLETLRRDLLGEAVEVLEAIDLEEDGRDNSPHIAEELGDLLLLVTMMIQIATEEGRFKMAQVAEHIVHKLIRRHPHVFADEAIAGLQDIYDNWDAIKAAEKAEKGEAPAGPLDGVPPQLPALAKAHKLQSKAAKAGLLDRAALAASMPELTALLGDSPTQAKVGQVLWVLAALAHRHEIDAEDALRSYLVHQRAQLHAPAA